MLPSLHIEIERWKLNKTYGLYVSTFGRVKDSQKHLMKQYISQSGYFFVKNVDKNIKVHRLVMATWVRESELTVDHLDGNRRNNRLSNLEYVSREENLRRAKNNQINVPEPLFSEPKKLKRIRIGKTNFNSMSQAVKWVKDHSSGEIKLSEKTNQEIEDAILEAFTNKSLFCNRRWHLIYSTKEN